MKGKTVGGDTGGKSIRLGRRWAKPGRGAVARGDFRAGSLADVQGPKGKLSARMCEKRHRWIRRKYVLECTRCGKVEELEA